MPPFLAEIVSAIRKPLRCANSISFFINMLPEEGNPPSPYVRAPHWVNVALLASGVLGSSANFQAEPVSMENTEFSWGGGPYFPYPQFSINNTAPATYSDAERNWCILRGYSSIIAMLNKNFTNGTQIVPNTWLVKVPKFTARAGTYFIPCVLADQEIKVPQAGVGVSCHLVNPNQVVSWEPVGYHSAIAAIVNLCTYFMPSNTDSILAPIFSATPNSTTVAPVIASHTASYLGQGSATAIEAATTSNPEEFASRKGAEANKGVIDDSSKQPPKHLEQKITEKITGLIGTDTGEKVKKGVSTTMNLVEKVGKIVTSV